jgi:hypothetical protein
MRLFLFSLVSGLLAALLFGSPIVSEAQEAEPQRFLSTVPDSKNQIIKLNDKGLSPQRLEMRLQDSIVFLLNDSSDSLLTVEIDFGKRHMHCAGSNTQAGSDGKIRSIRPFGPRDFASTCFHEPGEYRYTVYGLERHPEGVTGTIIVQ